MIDGLVSAAGASLGPEFWDPVFALYETAWPGMAGRIARASALGATWAPVTTPFAWFEGGLAVAHVGVIEHPIVLDGELRVVAGVHAVCTRPEHRRKGHAARLLRAATAWIDARHDAAKLHTDFPEVYAPAGFRVAPLHVFHGEGRGGGGEARILDLADPTDRDRLWEALRRRDPPSRRLATADPGWLPVIDACLARVQDTLFRAVPGRSWVGAWRVVDGALVVDDVIGPVLPSRDEVLDAVAEPFDRVVWRFCPDRFDPDAVAIEVPASEGVLQVRGRWAPAGPVGIPLTWEH